MSRSLLPRSLLTASLLMLLPGCQALGMLKLAEQEQQYIADRRLQARLLGEFAADPSLAGARVEVDVFLLDVTLRGEVGAGQQARMLAIADGIDEIGSIDNRLQLRNIVDDGPRESGR
jgi:hypothetical protein